MICYEDLQYVIQNWDAECDVIRRWCAVLGVKEGGYKIEKPESKRDCIYVSFNKAVELEIEIFDDSDSEMD